MLELYHGTQHQFDKFDLEFFGKGVGVANCGYGMYFTSDLAIAHKYASDVDGYIYTIQTHRQLNLLYWESTIEEEFALSLCANLKKLTATDDLELQEALGLGEGYYGDFPLVSGIYNYCEALLGDKKAVSSMLDFLGVDGILSPQEGENNNYTIFDIRGFKITNVEKIV